MVGVILKPEIRDTYLLYVGFRESLESFVSVANSSQSFVIFKDQVEFLAGPKYVISLRRVAELLERASK